MKKVVVIGGGFAGAKVAKKLEKEFDVTLIDTKDYFEFTPGILRTIVDPSHVKDIQVMHTHYLKRGQFIRAQVLEIGKNYVKTSKSKIHFDYLVISSGSSYAYPIKQSNIVQATRAAKLRQQSLKLDKAKSILIIGGGLVGVELAAEICDVFRDKNVTIVHSKDKLMDRNHARTIMLATHFLKKRGVKIVYDEKVIDGKGKTFKTDKGNTFEADLAFICTGIVPNYEFMKKNFPSSLNERNQIKVNDYLQLEGNIFAAGDVTDRIEEKTAQTAEKHALLVIENIRALEAKKTLKSYVSKKRPMVISLGRYNGVFEYKGLVIGGILPALMKKAIEFKTMTRYR